MLPALAGVLLGQWQPKLARRCSRALGSLATVLLIMMMLALLLLSGRQLLPFLQQNLVGLAGMAALSVLSLAIGYGLAGSDPLERRTAWGPGDEDAEHGPGHPAGADLRQGAARTGTRPPLLRADHVDRHHPVPEMAAAGAGLLRLIVGHNCAEMDLNSISEDTLPVS